MFTGLELPPVPKLPELGYEGDAMVSTPVNDGLSHPQGEAVASPEVSSSSPSLHAFAGESALADDDTQHATTKSGAIQLREQLNSLFQSYASTDGTCTGLEVLDILGHLGFTTDRASVRAALPSWDVVTIDDLFECVEQLTDDTQRQQLMTHVSTSETVVQLRPHQYVFAFLSGELSNYELRGVTVVVAMYDIKATPQQAVLFCSLSVLVVVSILIAVTVTTMWGSYATSNAKSFVQTYNGMVSVMLDGFRRESLHAAGDLIEDEVYMLGSIIDLQVTTRVDAQLQRMEEVTALLVNATNNARAVPAKEDFKTASAATLSFLEQRVGGVAALSSIEVHTPTPAQRATLGHVLNYNRSTSTMVWTPAPTHELASMCSGVVSPAGPCEPFIRFLDEVRRTGRSNAQLVVSEVAFLIGAAALVIGGEAFHVDVAAYAEVHAVRLQATNDLLVEMTGSHEAEHILVTRTTKDTKLGQSTPPRDQSSCLGECLRRNPAKANIEKGFLLRDTGNQITPNYVPAPVLGAYAFVAILDSVVLLEISVLDLVNDFLHDAVEFVNGVNAAGFAGSAEVSLVRQVDMPPTQVFDPRSSCEHLEVCDSVDGFGVVMRSDCLNCLRKPSTQPTLEWLTSRRKPYACRAMNGTNQCLLTADDVASEAVFSSRTYARTGTDYSGAEVYAVAEWSPSWSYAVVTTISDNEPLEHRRTAVNSGAGGAVVIVVIAFVLQLLASRKSMISFEQQWRKAQEKMLRERTAFHDMMSDVLPAHVVQQQLSTRAVYAEARPLAVSVLDICGFSSKISGWKAGQVNLLVTYYTVFLNAIAKLKNIVKVTQSGDTFTFCSNLEPVESTRSVDLARGVVNMLDFCMMAARLSTDKFAHYPAQIQSVAQTFGPIASKPLPDVTGASSNVGCIAMPVVKVGLHYGTVNCYVLRINETEKFELYGSTMNFTSRMAYTAKRGCVMVSSFAQEMLAMMPPNVRFRYLFGEKTKILLRGKGVIHGSMVASTTVRAPSAVMEAMNNSIGPARRRIVYGEKKADKLADDKSLHSTATYD